MSRLPISKTLFTKARVKGAAGVAGLTAVGLAIATLPGIATSAAWVDNEWVSATAEGEPGIGTLDCEVTDDFSTRGEGRFLSGQLLGIDLDTLAEVNGVEVLNDGTVTVDPATAQSLGDDAYANPLTADLLSLINLELTGLLQLPLDNNVGVVNQVAQAKTNGQSMGAAGAVNDSGAIALTPVPPGPTVPTSAELSLGALLSSVVGESLSEIVTDLADLDLSVGAVASSALLDACTPLWLGTDQEAVWESLERDYLIAGLSTTLESPLLGELVDEIQSSLTAIQNLVNGIASDEGLIEDLTTGLLGIVGPLLDTLTGGTPSLTIAASIDLAAVNTLLETPIEDPNGVVSIDLGSTPATIDVDLAALFDSTNGLNNQAPNTQLLINDTVINALTSAVATALTGFVTSLEAALDTAISSGITLTIDLDLPLSLITPAGVLNVSIDGPLTGLSATSSFDCTNPTNVLGCTLGAALALTVDVLDGTLIPVVTGLLGTVLSAPLALIVDTLILLVPTLTAPIVTFLGNALSVLFGENALVSLVVNAQNVPDPADGTSGPEPGWAAGLDPFQASPYETGQYDVSALRLTVLGGADVVELDLARSSVGNNVLD